MMKVLIVYYSQTGNTKLIAEAIKRGADTACDQVDLVDVRDAVPRKVREYDLVGIGGPAIGAEADIIKRFVYSIPLTGNQHAFAFNTHGSLPKQYFPVATRRLAEREFLVIGYKGWFSTVHIQCFPSPYYTDGHPDETDIAEAEAFGKEMVERSRRVANGEYGLVPELPPLPPPKPYNLSHGGVVEERGVHGDRQYDPSKCLYPKCRICMDNCPEKFIDYSKEPREYGSRGNKCTTNECCLCELLCPTGAIYIAEEDLQYGLDFLKDHHDFFESTLNEYEEMGDFRRKVPTSEVGWNTMYRDVHEKRPRMKAVKGGK
jgi:flavodoxin/NAD-dependent dihydropyrimidine dehydrogenase PreA subunit